MSTSIDQQFVEFIAKSLVSQPEAVQVERRIDERGVLLELTVAPEDLGRVIGKHGATAQSLRTLLRALGTKNDARYNLKIVDTDQPAEQSAPRESDEHQDPAPSTTSSWAASDDDSNDQSTDDEHIDENGNPSDHQPEDDQEEKPKVEAPAPESNETPHEDSMVDKTRKELAELDDLDV